MTNETKIGLGILSIAGGCLYLGYLHFKLHKVSSMIDVAVDDLSANLDITISDDLIEIATQKAIDREVHYISSRVSRDLQTEIRSQVRKTIDAVSTDIKHDVSVELTNQIKRLDIKDVEQEVILKAKEAVAEKFDRRLDGLLDEFNANLNNVQKIYSSIAKSMSKEQEINIMEDKKKTLTYKLGYAAGVIVVGCLTIAVIAVTIRFIMWLF